MVELITDKDIEEAKKWFSSKIKYSKRLHTYMQSRYDAEEDDDKRFPTYKSYTLAISKIYEDFAEMYEVMEGVLEGVYNLTKATNVNNSKLNSDLKKLQEKFAKHEPTIAKLAEAFEKTDKIFEKGC